MFSPAAGCPYLRGNVPTARRECPQGSSRAHAEGGGEAALLTELFMPVRPNIYQTGTEYHLFGYDLITV